jgi:hypothetical protein
MAEHTQAIVPIQPLRLGKPEQQFQRSLREGAPRSGGWDFSLAYR